MPSACPPPICTVSAVIKAASLPARKEITEATSLGCPNLPNMILFFQEAKTSGLVDLICAWKGVSMVPGETALTLIPYSAKSLASALVFLLVEKMGLEPTTS